MLPVLLLQIMKGHYCASTKFDKKLVVMQATGFVYPRLAAVKKNRTVSQPWGITQLVHCGEKLRLQVVGSTLV